MPVYTNSTDMIKAGAGDTFAIRLPSNPTTGYQWQMDELPSDAPVQVRTHDFEPPDSKLLGAGGHERWVFDTKHPGNIDLAFKYVRPWEPENVVRQHVFKVEIK